MIRPARLFSLVSPSLLVLVLLTTTARADTGAWDGFRALGVEDIQLAALRWVTTEALGRGGLVQSIVSDERVTERCGVDVTCHCTALRKRGLRLGAFGSLARLGDLWTIELTLVDAADCTVRATAFANESLADPDVPRRLAALARELTTPPTTIAETATGGSARPIDTTPAVVTTFTRRQLRALHVRHLDDLLPLVPGFDVVDANWGGLILNQGLQNTLLFLANGVPLVNGLNNFRALGRDFRTSFVHIDRIEIVRGPGAVLWGQNAFLGVVNLITDMPTRREATVDAGVAAGTLRTEDVWARGGQNRGSYAFVASVAAGRRIGPETTVPDSPQAIVGVSPVPFGNGGTARPAPDDYLDVVIQVALGKRIELALQNLTSDYQFEISPFGPLLDPNQGGFWKKTHRLYSATGTQPLFERENAKLVGRARISRYEYYSDENFAVQPLFPDGPVPATPEARDFRNGLRSLQGNSRPRVSNQLDVRVNHDVERGVASHLTAGVGVLHLQTPDSLATLTGIIEEPATPTISFDERRFTTFSSFVLEEFAPMPWLVFVGGARLQIDRRYETGEETRVTANFQGGAAIKRGRAGAKLVYAEGFRPPDAVQLYSEVGTKGNPLLVPEYSREVAAEIHFDVTDELVLRASSNLTRISDLIVFEPIFGDPVFAQMPVNRGKLGIASGFLVAQLASGGTPGLATFDGFASYGVTDLQEDGVDTIPIARHTAALGVVWRPLPDLSVFARGSFASPRRVRLLAPDSDPVNFKTSPTVRSALGLTLTDVFAGADLEVSIDNPLLLEHDAPYQLDGSVTRLVERRQGTEIFAALRYDR